MFENSPGLPPVDALRPEHLEASRPGPALALLLGDLDLEVLDEATLIEVIAAHERQAAYPETHAALAAAELARRGSMNPDWHGFAPADPCVASDELAMRLGWSKRASQRLVRDGRALDGELSAVADAVVDGILDGPRVRTLLDALRDEPYQVAWPVLAAVLPRAASRSVRQLRDDVERAVLAVCSDETSRRHEAAFARRRVDHPKRLRRGMAGIWAVMSAEDAAQLDALLEATARAARAAGDPRTLDQLRADTMVRQVIGGPHTGDEPATEDPPDTRSEMPSDGAPDQPNQTNQTNQPDQPDQAVRGLFDDLDRIAAAERATRRAAEVAGRRAPPVPRVRRPRIQINVTVPLSTLLGLDEVPATLDGYGPLSAAQARALAKGGVWRRLVTDPLTGAVLHVGRTRYRPPAELADHVRSRDGRCAEPGCGVPAERCDLDHTEEFFADGAQGTTSADNLGPLCHRANLLKTGGGFALTQPEPGRFVWTTPAGLRYETRPGLDGAWRRLAPGPGTGHPLPFGHTAG